MPFRQTIAEIERDIEGVLASMAAMRERAADSAALEPLLGRLARLKAERLRFIARQRLAAD